MSDKKPIPEGQKITQPNPAGSAKPETMPTAAPAKAAPPAQKVSVGRMVHYQAFGTPGGEHKSEPRAAIVTEVGKDGTTVGLAILNPTGLFFGREIKFSETPKPGHWNWPPKV